MLDEFNVMVTGMNLRYVEMWNNIILAVSSTGSNKDVLMPMKSFIVFFKLGQGLIGMG